MADLVSYLVFDVEAVADGDLISSAKYPKLGLSPAEAIEKFREERMAEYGRDILPPTWMLPISVAIAKIDSGFRLLDLVVLDPPGYRPHVITDQFWKGWKHYDQPTLVTFNGRGYDLPVLELAAYRFGITLPEWFNVEARSYDQARYRYNIHAHIDLMDLVSNFGASRVNGGLNLLANLIGKPGKTGVDGSMVQGFYDEGRVEEINDYCRCDVLDTYFVFLRSRVLIGRLDIETEQRIVAETKAWLEERRDDCPAYGHYLDHWGDWQPPGEQLPEVD
ncbi:MAG: 3'-5' exonuclease [Planctomycetaceae bacterium]